MKFALNFVRLYLIIYLIFINILYVLKFNVRLISSIIFVN